MSIERSIFDATASQATRDRRQQVGHQLVLSLSALVRNARSHAEDNAIFTPVLETLQQAMAALLESDGSFELELVDDGFYLNRQALRFEAINVPLVAAVRSELAARGVRGLSAQATPPPADLRSLVRLLSPRGVLKPGTRGEATRPFAALRLLVSGAAQHDDAVADRSARLVSAYSHAVFFVDHTIQQLRVAGELIPLWAASRVVQDLVDLQQQLPRRFLQLARVKAESDDYWGHHAANVAVLAISFGARLGLARARRHDLGMAALFHDVGMAAIPSALLEKRGQLDARAQTALKASPLFAARAILRDREVHPAALERALAAYECHLELVPASAESAVPDIGLTGRILAICESYDALTTVRPFRPVRTHQQALRVMTTELVFKFDPELVDLLPEVVEPLLERS